MRVVPETAMVLAAGLGKRMRPITDNLPKPLVPVAGKPLIDWGLDSLAEAGVTKAVVNVHYLPDQVIAHTRARQSPKIVIADERNELLDSAGGIVNARNELGNQPFFVLNADTFWIDRDGSNLERLALAWRTGTMDILLMLASFDQATGHTGSADFLMAADGRLSRARGDAAGLIYAGAAIVDPAIFSGASAYPHSLNLYFDQAIATGRLHGMSMEGSWITVGTPEAIEPAETAVAQAQRKTP